MSQSPTEVSPNKRGLLRLKRADSTQCASCPALTECPACPEGRMCQLLVPPLCNECPINACVADPAYHKSPSNIGGALGGIVACFVAGTLFYWIYRQRKQRSKQKQRRLREAAKIRMAEGEKFRPGDAKVGPASPRSRQASKDTNFNPFRDDRSKGRNGEDEDEIEVADEDTEWTELREDGLTAYRKPPGSSEDLIQPESASDKRRSIGAATHLSRITEGFEEEDEDRNPRYMVTTKGTTIDEEEEPRSIASQRNRGRTSVVSTRSEGDERCVDGSRRNDSLVIDRNPFLDDGSDAGSLRSHPSYDGQRASSILLGAMSSDGDAMHRVGIQPPSPAHRPLGAPLVDLQGKQRSDIRSYRNSQLESPLTSLVRKPSRLVRKLDLTLLLNDATLPDSGQVRESIQSHESGNVLRQSELLYLADSDDKTEKAQQFPADQLLSSHVYQRNKTGDLIEDKRCSTATASSAGSMAYVMSAPKIITPIDQGVQRFQLHQGKAQLIRVVGLQDKAETEAKDRGKSREALIRNPQSTDLSMLDSPFNHEREEKEDDGIKSPTMQLSSNSLSSPRSARHSNVPEDETEDEVEGSQAEVRTHRTGKSSDFDEVRLQYELAEYPFKRADAGGQV